MQASANPRVYHIPDAVRTETSRQLGQRIASIDYVRWTESNIEHERRGAPKEEMTRWRKMLAIYCASRERLILGISLPSKTPTR